MKHFYSILIGLFIVTEALSQSRVITGRLTDSSGSPIPGINIFIKGTSTGTITDIDGNYSISAPVGTTLVFSGIGFATREVVVESDNSSVLKDSKKPKQAQTPFPFELLNDSLRNTNGVGVFDYQSKTYKSQTNPRIVRINKVREQPNRFVLKTLDDPVAKKGYGLQYAQLFGISHITQLPGLQSTYAQGRTNAGSLQWYGPDSNEVFSWGPRVNNLEYDGSPYPYDVNGRLVTLGNGNGKAANTYNNRFYRVGLFSKYSLLYTQAISRKGDLVAGINFANQNGVIPNSNKNNLATSLELRNVNVGVNSKLSFNGLYANASGNILNHGANIARIVGDALSAPVTFDNANGLSFKDATSNNSSYEIAPGQLRSYAPQFANNPFGLFATSPDHDEQSQILSAVKYEWENNYDDRNTINITANGSYDYQKLVSKFGIPYAYIGSDEGILTKREDLSESTQLRVTPSYTRTNKRFASTYWTLSLYLDYRLSNTNRSLSRVDGFGFANMPALDIEKADSVASFQSGLNRTSHQISTSAKFILGNDYTFNIGNTFYFSNTINQKSITNFFPYFGLKADVEAYPFFLTPKASFSRSVQESSLVYNDWAYQSTNLNSGDFRKVYESSELVYSNNIGPETVTKFEFDLETRFDFLYSLLMNLNYGYEIIDDYIAPVMVSNRFQLTNVASVSNEFFKAKLDYLGGGYWGRISFDLGLRWTKNIPKVISINSQDEFIPLAGFSNAVTVLSEGQPFGAIYGTFYERNSTGELVIGQDGFPISTGELKSLGNPNPDGVAGLDGTIQWRNFQLTMILEYAYGAEVWNGTAAYLDYLGRSSKTESQRSITDYIFDGVDSNGNTNTTSVNFYSPAEDISQNRWVRYGPGGVSEAYIEKVNSFRLSKLMFYFEIPLKRSSAIRELSFTLSGQNLLQITPYSGVDPESELFGYASGQGLDMFNMPSIRSYELKMMIKL